MPIEGKVAQIKDTLRVIINKGYEHGVEEGMRFVIYRIENEIFDPDTKESLGFFEHVKAKIKVEHVADKYSIAISDETRANGSTMLQSFTLFGTRSRIELPLDEETQSQLKVDNSNNIQVGDLVKEVRG
jgi:hypothetical protein